MNRTRILFLSLLLAGLLAGAENVPNSRLEAEKAIEKVFPAIVRFHVVYTNYEGGRARKGEAYGSGVIISAEGYAVTNYHVIDRTVKKIFCTIATNEEIEADVVGQDALTDIAVVKLRLEERKDRKIPVKFASFGSSAKVKIGDPILAMGSPRALSRTITAGIIGNTKLSLPYGMNIGWENVGAMVLWLGHDAQILPGNSGGPLVNMQGEIIGINELGLGGSLDAAIPSDVVEPVVREITKKGKVERSWTGLTCGPLLKNSGEQKGALVTDVFKASPAEDAGVEPGDILLNYDGSDITINFSEDLPFFFRLVAGTPIGKEVTLKVKRGGKELVKTLKTKEREVADPGEVEFKEWGFTGSNLTERMMRQRKRTTRDGVVVFTVKIGGQCEEAKPAIKQNDVLVSVNGKAVKNIEELKALTEELTKGHADPVPVIVAFDREAERWMTIAKIGFKDINKSSEEAKKSYLGASFQVLTSGLAEQLKLKNITGVMLTCVYKNTAAEKAGLLAGDIITTLDGDNIAVNRPEETEVFTNMIKKKRAGQTFEMTVFRLSGEPADYREMKLPVKFERSPAPKDEMKKYEDRNFEFTVRDISFFDYTENNADYGEKGVFVETVQPGGWAALARLNNGSIIQSVDGQKVEDIDGFISIMEAAEKNKKKRIVFFVKKGIYTDFIQLECVWLK